MTVNPGFGGQSFIPSTLETIARGSGRWRAGRDIDIEVDGGIGPETVALAAPRGRQRLRGRQRRVQGRPGRLRGPHRGDPRRRRGGRTRRSAVMLRALIFDVDGTLAETEDLHRQAFNGAFAELGLRLVLVPGALRRSPHA